MSHTDFEQSGHAYLQSTVYSVVSWKTVYSVVSWITILSYLLYLLVMFSHFLQTLLMDGVSAGQNCYIVPWFKQVLQQNQYCRFVLEGCSIIPWWEVEEKLKEKIPQNKWGSRDALLLQHKGGCSWEGLSNNSLVDSQIVQVKRFSGGQRKKVRGYLMQKLAYHTCNSERNFHVRRFWNKRSKKVHKLWTNI